MQIIRFLSDITIPIIIFYITASGLIHKVNIFDEFIQGAKEGFLIVLEVLPTLIGLMLAIGLLRDSGALDSFAVVIAPVSDLIHFPKELVPLTLIKMVSSSAATGLLIDLYDVYGPDSRIGYMASLFMCCSETILYTISVYFMATKDENHPAIHKMRWTLAGSLLCTFTGTVASVILTDLLR